MVKHFFFLDNYIFKYLLRLIFENYVKNVFFISIKNNKFTITVFHKIFSISLAQSKI
jgi:hypothetical protein